MHPSFFWKHHFLGRRFNAQRVFCLVTSLLSAIRLCVGLFEAFATVRAQRAQDAELLAACAAGTAQASPRMRSACLSAQADRASPLLLKAILHACNSAWEDFYALFSTPTSSSLVILFAVVTLLMPLRSWVSLLSQGVRSDEEHSTHIVVVPSSPNAMGLRRRAGAMFNRSLRLRAAQLEQDGLDGPHFVELGAVGCDSDDTFPLAAQRLNLFEHGKQHKVE